MTDAPYAVQTVMSPSSTLATIAHLGAVAWPHLDLDELRFCQVLTSRVESVPDGCRYLEQLERHAADLYLAVACANGDGAALLVFDHEYIGKTGQIVRRLRLSAAQLDELTQQLRIRVLLATDGNPPRINQYTGRGRLLDWFRVLAMRAAMDLFRDKSGAEAATASVTIEAALHERMISRSEPEQQLLRTRYKREYEQALRTALQQLDADSRNLLKLHFVKGLNGAQIGALLRVNRSTIMRRLDKVQEDLRSTICEHLITALHLSPADIESINQQLLSQLSLSMSSFWSSGE